MTREVPQLRGPERIRRIPGLKAARPDYDPDSPTVATPDADTRPEHPDARDANPDGATANSEPEAKSVMLVQRVLKADIKYLLSKFYLYYSMLPAREGLRDELTNRAGYER